MVVKALLWSEKSKKQRYPEKIPDFESVLLVYKHMEHHMARSCLSAHLTI